MKKVDHKNAIGNSTKSNVYYIISYSIMILTIIISIGMLVFQSYFIYPSFMEKLVKNTEKQAVQIGKHMSRSIEVTKEGVLNIKKNIIIPEVMEDYDLWKLRIFSRSGEII